MIRRSVHVLSVTGLIKESLGILMVGDLMSVKAEEGGLREALKESISLLELPWQAFRALRRDRLIHTRC